MKKGKWASIKSILFAYLALNKILYWFNTITSLEQTDFSTVINAILSRFLSQDLIMIVILIAFFYLENKIEQKKAKYNNMVRTVMLYGIGYVMFIGIAIIYNLLLTLFYTPPHFTVIGFVRSFLFFIPTLTIWFIVAVVALEIKQYFKSKEKEMPADIMHSQSTDDKISMLQTLLEDGILTQEEFDRKKTSLQSV
jgi:uncharacterized membrane protein